MLFILSLRTPDLDDTVQPIRCRVLADNFTQQVLKRVLRHLHHRLGLQVVLVGVVFALLHSSRWQRHKALQRHLHQLKHLRVGQPGVQFTERESEGLNSTILAIMRSKRDPGRPGLDTTVGRTSRKQHTKLGLLGLMWGNDHRTAIITQGYTSVLQLFMDSARVSL